MAELFKIVQCLDEHLTRNNLEYIRPVEAGQMLERAGLLGDSKSRRGAPLRKLLREGELPHARQPGGGGTPWFIYHSSRKFDQNESDAEKNEVQTQKFTASKSVPTLLKNNPSIVVATSDHSQLEAQLMLESSFQPAGLIDELVPHEPGVYCIRITDLQALPEAYRKALDERGHNIIYIGLASESLNQRFLGQELRARGHGTFFRSVGAMLGYLPMTGSLADKKNKKNYVFSVHHEQEITRWMNTYLVANWLEVTGDTHSLESYLIPKHMPLLNLAKNPKKLAILSAARKKCCEIACRSADCDA